MDIKSRYLSEIAAQVEELALETKNRITDTDIKEYYHGWRVFFSPVIDKPKVLIIGINPGNGQSGVEDWSFWENDEIFEYINTDYNFSLARETREVFEMAMLSDVLHSSTVKTNYFYLSTTTENDLYTITSFLGRIPSETDLDPLGERIFRKSAEWTNKIIDILQPQVILCEGKAAYDNVTHLFPEYGEYGWSDDCGFTIIPDKNTVIIGYSRFKSRIRNKTGLAKLLSRFIK